MGSLGQVAPRLEDPSVKRTEAPPPRTFGEAQQLALPASIGAKVAHVRREAAKGQSRPHHCHADGCDRQCPPAYFMCPRHWRMVSAPLQRAVWRGYAIAQERGEADVSREYLQITRRAIVAVALIERRGRRVLCFGSRSWTSVEIVESALLLAAPSAVIEGEAAGAGVISGELARRRRVHVDPFPIDRRFDGSGSLAPKRRNERQLREGAPDVGLGFVVGALGSRLTPGSRDMLERLLAAGVWTAIYRDGGSIESEGSMRRLARR